MYLILIPTVEEIFNKLPEGKYSIRLDIYSMRRVSKSDKSVRIHEVSSHMGSKLKQYHRG